MGLSVLQIMNIRMKLSTMAAPSNASRTTTSQLPQGTPAAQEKPKKLVVITGGANGLGLGCALRFADMGVDIVIADINERAAQAALPKIQARNPAIRVDFERLDLADFNDTSRTAERLVQRGRPIDLLVNNAGIYPPSQRTLTRDGHELTFAIAYLGHVVLTNALWPLLEAADAARVITISSVVQRTAQVHFDDLTFTHGYEPIRAYQQAKVACLLFALELQRRLAASGSRVKSYAAHPGACRTELASNRRIQEGDTLFQRFSSAFMAFGMHHFGQTPEEGAESVVLAATSDSIPPGSFIGPLGLFEFWGRPGVSKLGPVASDERIAKELWERTAEMTKLRWPF
jgi:NAD(P)-dependent dehydrogenase (short-subunit alcohol dehydrogenase family)